MSIESDPDCLFCKIVAGEIPCTKVYEDQDILAFKDIHPQAPFHVLLIPKTHLSTLNDVTAQHAALAGKLFLAAKGLASEHGLAGYRVAVNVNREGGQVVFHLHMHMLAGRQMKGTLG
jgi:histidine triad (HIT) family protein